MTTLGLRRGLFLLAGLAVFILATAAHGASSATPVAREDLLWLSRIGYGASSATLSSFAKLGRAGTLAQELKTEPTTASATALRGAMTPAPGQEPTEALIEEYLRQRSAVERRGPVKPAPAPMTAEAKRQARRDAGALATDRHLERALGSPRQLRERLAWFWLNHFNVWRGKGDVSLYLEDFEARMRPHLTGRFRDLLEEVLRHPAMLVYLDNAQSWKTRLNENYARELMEVHTLGVDGGYTQRDVQELARILTGVGLNLPGKRRTFDHRAGGRYLREGIFEFNPAGPDLGHKALLGHTIRGRGFDEVEEALDLLAGHQATAEFLSRKLATHFVADDPPQALVQAMSASYLASNGRIDRVLTTMFLSPAMDASLGRKFKSPMEYIVSMVRLAGDGQGTAARHIERVRHALHALGQPVFGKRTPDGYGLRGDDWTDPGQMTTRLELARRFTRSLSPLELATAVRGMNERRALLSDENKALISEQQEPRERLFLFLVSPGFMTH